ncbi:MAG: hypothetical protein WCA97_00495 [Terriglobales bacterium]|jgi:hypothetical protein
MIQPLRTMHRRAFVGLAFVLPAILVVGLGARRPRLSQGIQAIDVPAPFSLVRESGTLWQNHAIQSKFYGRLDRPRDIYVVLQPLQELNEPDLLLYWASSASLGNVLPPDARIVGAYRMNKAFLLPLNSERAGRLVLFSLAHQTVFDSAGVDPLP